VKGNRYRVALDVLEELVAFRKARIEDTLQSITVQLEMLRDKFRGLSAPDYIFGLLILDWTEIFPRTTARWLRRVGWIASDNTIRLRGQAQSFVICKLLRHFTSNGPH
jgi:hypothetical protein